MNKFFFKNPCPTLKILNKRTNPVRTFSALVHHFRIAIVKAVQSLSHQAKSGLWFKF